MQIETYGIRQPTQSERRLLVRMGYAGIYFLGWENDAETDPIKIGIAADPFTRFASIQCGNWRRLKVHEILHVRSRPHEKDFRNLVNSDGMVVGRSYDAYGQDYIPVRAIEAAVHKRLKEQGFHHSGEWFRGGTQSLVAFVKDAVTLGFQHEYLTHASMLRRLKMWKIEAEAA